MARYKQVIEAILFEGFNKYEIDEFVGHTCAEYVWDDSSFLVVYDEQRTRVYPGQFLIRNKNGKYFTMDEIEFYKIYEPDENNPE